MRIAIKYCGCCNPEVNLARVEKLIAEQARELGWEVVPSVRNPEADILLLLCGCPRSCANTEEMQQNRKKTVLVAGRRLGWQPTSEEKLPSAIVDAIQELSQRLGL